MLPSLSDNLFLNYNPSTIEIRAIYIGIKISLNIK